MTEQPSDREAVLRKVPGWDLDRIQKARILVIGCGALGNEVLKNLALIGVGELFLLDFDVVETSNLSRSVLFREGDEGQKKAKVAAARIQELNPRVQTTVLDGDVGIDLGLGLLKRMDTVIGCVDNRLARLWINRLCFRLGKPWISGGILNFSGQVTGYSPEHACYECGLGKAAWDDIRARMGCADMARRYEQVGQVPTTPVAASVIGAWQAQEALKIVLETPGESVLGRIWSLEGAMLHSAVYDLKKPEKGLCRSHEIIQKPVVKLNKLHADMTFSACLGVLNEHFTNPGIHLDYDVATRLATGISKEEHEVTIAMPHLSEELAKQFQKVEGEPVGAPRGALWSVLDSQFPNPEATLLQLGIPHLQILRIESDSGLEWVELSGDKARFNLQI